MVHKDQINTANEQVKFSVSRILCNVARQGLHMFQESWTHHRYDVQIKQIYFY